MEKYLVLFFICVLHVEYIYLPVLVELPFNAP